MVFSTLTIQDILPSSNRTSGKKIDRDTILPFFILPGLLLISTLSRTITIIIMAIIGMGALYVHSRPKEKNRSPFFYSWTISSGITMFVVFETYILSLLEITHFENIIFLILLSCTCYFLYKMKTAADYELSPGPSIGKEYSPVLTSDSHYCQICQIEVNERLFHSIWWNCCVSKPNYLYFLAGQIFAFATLFFAANLGLTTVCQPFLLYDILLMPDDCEGMYDEFQIAISFVCCVYALGYIVVICLVLIRQVLVYIPKYKGKKLINILSV